MKRFNKTNGMYALLIAVAAMIGITIYGSCSADEDFWGFDEEFASTKNTRAEKMDMSDYLTLSTYNEDDWTDEDYTIMVMAEERMGVSFMNNQYVFSATCGREINVSDSLYYLIRSEYELTNTIINSNPYQKKVRAKRGDPESSPSPNCVAVALCHMGQDPASSVQEAESICTLYDNKWREHGGVYTNRVLLIIEEFTSVTERDSITDSDSITEFDECVMLIPTSLPNIDHAVNARKYIKKNNGTRKIRYYDYWNHKSGSIGSSEITYIYTFN